MKLSMQSRISAALAAGVLCASCDSAATITAPSAVQSVVATAVTADPDPVAEAPPPPSVASHPSPPPAAVVPVLNTTPIGLFDCDFTDPRAVRCYNKSDISQTWTAVMKDLQPDGAECHVTYGKHTVAIAPRSNGYFTLPMPPCRHKGQIDMYQGETEGDCRNAAFTAQRVYDGGACPEPPPPPPVPPPPPPPRVCPIRPPNPVPAGYCANCHRR